MPLVPFARACLRAGHEVRVAAPRAQGGHVERMGLDLHACSDPAKEDIARLVGSLAELGQREGHAHMMSEGFARVAARAVLADVVEVVDRWRPEVVVRESQEYAGALAAERAGVPHVRVALGLAAQENETLSTAATVVDELRTELGLPGDLDASALRDSPYLTLVPPLLEEPDGAGPAATHRFRDLRNGAPSRARLPGWASSGADPLVYLTFGSVVGALGLFPRVYRPAIEALAELPARVLVTVGENADPSELAPVPQNVYVERSVSQGAILEQAVAVICHGGYGSVLGALAAGVPVVAVPIFADDQWRNGRRVAELGAGIALDGDRGPTRRMLDGPGSETFAALADAVGAILADRRYRSAAQGIAAAIDLLPPADAAVEVLGTIVRDRASR
jgi:UDP:flavonoid glycosyltransferase YjiC (YdhE family)